MKQLKRVGAFFYVPLLFMFFGYLIIYIIGAPVIDFATSAVELISLNDAQNFEQKGINLFEQKENIAVSEANTSTGDVVANNDSVKEKLASSNLVYPTGGDQFGKVVIDKVAINEPLYYGDSEDILSKGVGQYLGSMIPGELGTTLIGGHNMPTFGKIYYLEPGDSINVHTHYGEYTYQVTEVKIADYKEPSITNQLGDRTKRSLILYTCYPLDAIGLTAERVFVLADYVAGPVIDEKS